MLLQATSIGKSYGHHTILSNISFQVQQGDRIGLVGVNGAGKSTLMQVLCGVIPADSGDIHRAKETTIAYLAQQSGLQSNRTMWDEMLTVFSELIDTEAELRHLEQQMADISSKELQADESPLLRRYDQLADWYQRHGGYEYETKIKAVLHGMGFAEADYVSPIDHLSGGQKTRLALAKTLLQSPDILMLDEPTNHLDIPSLTWLESHLTSFPGAVVVISHDRYFLDAVVNTIYEIERTEVKRYTGNYSTFIERKRHDAALHQKDYEHQQAEISRMEDFIQRNLARASTTRRAQSRRKALERMERIEQPIGEMRRASFSFEIERPSGKDVLNVRDLAAGYEPESPLFQDINFRLSRGETVALIGPNGIGKSTLLKTLISEHPASHGTVEWGTNVAIGYYDQELADLTDTNTILDEVWNAYPQLEEARIRTVLGNFLFSGEDVLKRIRSLSGGEKARVALAKLMLQQANVLILDEPTNHLDLYSKEVLESSLVDYEGTLLFISHDRYFLNKMAERIIELSHNGASYFLGNYDDYVEKKQDIAEANEEQIERAKTNQHKEQMEQTTSSYEADKRARQLARNKQRRIEQLEQQIAALEQEVETLELQLTDPEVYGDYTRVQEVNEQLEQKQKMLAEAYETWEELMS